VASTARSGAQRAVDRRRTELPFGGVRERIDRQRDTATVGDGRTLTALLGQALVALTIEIDNGFERGMANAGFPGFRTSFAMWKSVVRHVSDDGIAEDLLADAAGLPVGAVRFLTGGLSRWGYLAVDDATVRPTPAGRAARRLWDMLPERVEAEWRKRHGKEVVEGLGGADVHGALSAELLTIGAAFEASLALHLNLLRVLGDDPTRARDLPVRTGIARESIDVLIREATTLRLVEPGTLRLTSEGAITRTAARDRLTDIELGRPDHTSPLRVVVAGAAPGLEPAPGSWRTMLPHKARTEAFRNDPAASLPHHAMPVRQGGWPDGA
jgi:hypothetical protein